MPTRTITGIEVEVDDDGFLKHAGEWTQRMAPVLAREAGISALTPEHWKVIDFMRHEYFEKGTGPTVRVLGRTSGVPIKDLYRLFPKGPAKVAAKIAGIPKPRGCI